jgi:hypothetical protein
MNQKGGRSGATPHEKRKRNLAIHEFASHAHVMSRDLQSFVLLCFVLFCFVCFHHCFRNGCVEKEANA